MINWLAVAQDYMGWSLTSTNTRLRIKQEFFIMTTTFFKKVFSPKTWKTLFTAIHVSDIHDHIRAETVTPMMMAMHRGPQNDLPCTQLCRASYSHAVRTTLLETYHLPSCLQTEPPPIIATTLPPTSPHQTSLCQQPNAFEQLKTLWFEM